MNSQVKDQLNDAMRQAYDAIQNTDTAQSDFHVVSALESLHIALRIVIREIDSINGHFAMTGQP